MTIENLPERQTKAVNAASHFIVKKQGDFAAVLPSHVDADTFTRLAVGVMRKSPDLAFAAQANPMSLWHALMECSRLGHEPGTDQFALVKFNNKNAPGGVEVVGIEQYQGKIERMYRASIPGEFGVQSIICDVVRENDLYIEPADNDGYRPVHRRGWFCTEPPGKSRHRPTKTQRGPLVAAYAYAELAGGSVSKVVYLDSDQIADHKAAARSKAFWDGTWEEAMWLKTVVHELETWVPTSAEYRRQALAEAAVRQSAPRSAVVESDGHHEPPQQDQGTIRVEAQVGHDGA